MVTGAIIAGATLMGASSGYSMYESHKAGKLAKEERGKQQTEIAKEKEKSEKKRMSLLKTARAGLGGGNYDINKTGATGLMPTGPQLGEVLG